MTRIKASYLELCPLKMEKYSLTVLHLSLWNAGLGGSVGCASHWRLGGRRFGPTEVGNIFVEIDHEIFSTVILSLLLILEGQLSVCVERMCTILRGLSLPSKSVVR